MVLLRCTASVSLHGSTNLVAPTRATIRKLSLTPSNRPPTPPPPHSSISPTPKLWSNSPGTQDYGAITRQSTRSELESPRQSTRSEVVRDAAKPQQQQQQQSWHSLPSGLRLEVLSIEADNEAEARAAVVFVHGSYHAAWCWAVHWLPYFASLGYDCYAVSLQGQGESDSSEEPGTIQSHARDVAHFVSSQRCCCNRQRPVFLVGHSFGGLIVQYYLSQVSTTGVSSNNWGEPYPPLAGAILACSVPPTGNSAVVKRFLMSKPMASIKVTLSLAAKMFTTSVPLCRETFFSPSMPEEDVVRYQTLMKQSSKLPLFDLRKLNASLPVPSPPVQNAAPPPVLVIGAENDFILDKQGIQETARFLGTKEVMLRGMPHDVMLDVGWRDAADVIDAWMLTKI